MTFMYFWEALNAFVAEMMGIIDNDEEEDDEEKQKVNF